LTLKSHELTERRVKLQQDVFSRLTVGIDFSGKTENGRRGIKNKPRLPAELEIGGENRESLRPTLWKCLNNGRIRQAFWKVFLDFLALLSKRKKKGKKMKYTLKVEKQDQSGKKINEEFLKGEEE
jgi:hypothetical protein